MIYSLEEFKKYDKIKSKIMKFVLYKKRTEQEVRQKFAK
jgi:SOS response regulatory protein OraA/RecX